MRRRRNGKPDFTGAPLFPQGRGRTQWLMENANTTVVPPSPAPHLLEAALRGEPAAWPPQPSHGLADELLHAAEIHGVAGLVHARGTPPTWPPRLREQLRQAATRQAMWELRHQQQLTDALRQLASAGIQPVLLKGTPLAYSLYPDPAVRRRGDTDLIVPAAARERAMAVLLAAGWHLEPGVRGEYISYQATLSRRTPEGLHALDLHWRINNAQVLARLFTYEELRARAGALPRLAPNALGPDPVDSLLIACMHRATHRHNPYHVGNEAHHDPDRLIWLTDIDLLARSLAAPQWAQLVERAASKKLRRVTLQGLRRAQDVLGTPLPPGPVHALAAIGAEPPADYLEAGRPRQLWLELRALPPGAALRYLRELVFPPAAYMREKFGGSRQFLPLLYLRRAAGGLVKRLRSHS